MEGRQIATGVSSAQGFDVERLAMWVLWAVDALGQEAAADNLNRFLDSETIQVTEALWILGAELEETIELYGGFRIVPIGAMMESRQKDEYSRPGGVPTPRAAICVDLRLAKVLPEPLQFQYSEHMGLISEMYVIAALINVLDHVGCLPHLRIPYYPSSVPTGLFGRLVFSEDEVDILGRASSTIDVGIAPELDVLRVAFRSLGPNEQTRYMRALLRLAQSRRRSKIEDKLLDLGIALEMVLLDDNNGADQLALTFRLRGSWLLGSSADERHELHEQLRSLYTWRSQVAHTGVLCGGKQEKIREVESQWTRLSSLGGRIFKTLLANGRPDWTELVLGADGHSEAPLRR